MKWLGTVLLGPTLWAVLFVVIYALHGVFCAAPAEGFGTVARLILLLVWALGLLAFAPLLRAFPAQAGLRAGLPRAGLWIGLGASVFTLFPLAVTTSCGG
ncbi:MAG: hypothetical protein JJU09_02480 [Rhodobacteraceae bacterium]|nr:hypothetical protein [Paracoccaceae bacterium]